MQGHHIIECCLVSLSFFFLSWTNIPTLNCYPFSVMQDHFKKKPNFPITLKYIDPTYMIRAVKSNASDNVYCTLLAHSALHGAMAGYTGFTVAPVNGRHAYIPFYVSPAPSVQLSSAPEHLTTYAAGLKLGQSFAEDHREAEQGGDHGPDVGEGAVLNEPAMLLEP